MTILNTYSDVSAILVLPVLAIFIGLLVVVLIGLEFENIPSIVIGSIIFIFGVYFTLFHVPSHLYLEALVEDYNTIDFTRYEITEQNGLIITLRDKESVKYAIEWEEQQ